MYIDRAKGAVEIRPEVYAQIEEHLQTLSKQKSYEVAESLGLILADFIPLEDYVYTNMISKGKIAFEDNHAKWVTTEQGTNDGMMSPGSYFEIKQTTLKDIHAVPYVFDEDVCDG